MKQQGNPSTNYYSNIDTIQLLLYCILSILIVVLIKLSSYQLSFELCLWTFDNHSNVIKFGLMLSSLGFASAYSMTQFIDHSELSNTIIGIWTFSEAIDEKNSYVTNDFKGKIIKLVYFWLLFSIESFSVIKNWFV